MSAIDQLFRQRRAAGRKAFMPFITAVIRTGIHAGPLARNWLVAAAISCELGIPYSDPIADAR